MRVDHLGGTIHVVDSTELELVLDIRDERDANHFFLADDDDQSHPVLAIAVRGTAAHVHYFPHDGHPGFTALGDDDRVDEVIFHISEYPADDIRVMGSRVLTLERAWKIAHEFLHSQAMSSVVRWDEL